MTTSNERVLVLGGPSSGKSTLLMQLYGRAASGECQLTNYSAPESLSAISEGWKRLQQGLPPAHTSHGTDTSLTLTTVDQHGRHLDITIPDYAGEDLQGVGNSRRVSDRWRDMASASNHWILLVRLSHHPDIPDLISRPVGQLASAAPVSPDGGASDTLPVDMLAVELLQILRHIRSQTLSPPAPVRLTLGLSCWDELEMPVGTVPADVAFSRLALVDSFCRARFGSGYSVVGLSSQGRPLSEGSPDGEFIDYGPHKMGWLVREDGTPDSDLTKLIAAQ